MGRNRAVGLTIITTTVVAAAMLAPGCSAPKSDKSPATPATGVAVPAPAETVLRAKFAEGQDQTVLPPPVRYSCEDGTGVVAEYVESHTGEQHVNLDFGDKEIGLALAQSASGAKYEGPAALVPGKKTAWWTKGEEAMLVVADSEDSDGSTETVVNCQEVSS